MIDVAFTRAELVPSEVTVVIDVLRATSTVARALAAGYRRVLIADSVERARELRAPGRVLAGERQCVKPEGFDQGNSPSEAARRMGTDLVLATTNGAPTVIVAAKRSPTVILASWLNLDAIVAALLDQFGPASASTIQLACSGTAGRPALEDVYVAGLISARLPGARTDSALIAEAVTRGHGSALQALSSGTDASVLFDRGLGSDVSECATASEFACIPRVVALGPDVAIVTDSTSAQPTLPDDVDAVTSLSASGLVPIHTEHA